MSILLILISGLRNRAVGSDTYRYILDLEKMPWTNWSEILQSFWDVFLNSTQEQKDPGYQLFQKLLSYFTTDQVPFLLIIATITIIPLSVFLKKNATSKEGLFFAFVFYISMIFVNIPNQIIRMSIAFALICLGYVQLQKERNIYFFLLIAIASTFHKSSLMIILFWLCCRFLNPKLVFYSTPVGFLFVLIYPEFIILTLEGSSGAYDIYFQSLYYSFNSKPYAILIVMAAIYAIMLLGLCTGKVDWNKYKLAIIGTSFAVMLTPVVRIDPVLFRLMSYFAPWIMILVPETINVQKPSIKRLLYFILVVMFAVKALGTEEYRFYWQEMQLNDTYFY